MGNSPMTFHHRMAEVAGGGPAAPSIGPIDADSLRTLFEQSPDGIMLVDDGGTIRFANAAAESIFGRAGRSIVGGEFGIPLVAADKTDIDIPRDDGSVEVYELRVADTTLGGIQAQLVMLRDVTERVRHEAHILELNRELQVRAQAASVLTHVGDGVILLDDDGIVRFLNPAAERILGIDSELVMNAAVVDWIPQWMHVDDAVTLVEAPFRDNPRGQSVVIDQHGRETWLSVTGVRFDAGTIYAFHDLTEEVRVDRLKKDFIDTASHELRTPLTSIYGAAHTLQRSDLHIDESVRSQLVDVICTQSRRLQKITDDILVTRRLENEPRNLLLESFDAGDLARDIVETTAAGAPDDIELRVIDQLENARTLHTDQDKLRQVLVNLVQNAVKYSPDGGRVDVTVLQRDDWLQFEVRDQGIGVAETDLTAIFDKFFRAQSGRSSTIAGTGLGLYIARELIERLHGSMWVDSRAGDGSTFFVRIPLRSP